VLLRNPFVQVPPLEVREFSGKKPAIAFTRPIELDAALLSALAPVAGPGRDEFAFEFGEATAPLASDAHGEWWCQPTRL
jgi:hypothetical protein